MRKIRLNNSYRIVSVAAVCTVGSFLLAGIWLSACRSGSNDPSAETPNNEEQTPPKVHVFHDVNDDGYTDVAIASRGNGGGTNKVSIFHGGADGLSATPAIVLSDGSNGTGFGDSVAFGDVNGDGFADLAVGAPSDSSSTGKVYVFHGSAAGLVSPAATVIAGSTSTDYFGEQLIFSDLNHDGRDDLVVGSPDFGSYRGRVWVYQGGALGLDSTPAQTLTGENATTYLGLKIVTADFNADGTPDIAVSAPWHGNYAGRVYEFLGATEGIGTVANQTFSGEFADDRLGTAVVAADFNHDGFDDLAVTAYGFGSTTGRVYVYSGGAAGLSDATPQLLNGEAAGDLFGIAITAGDLNGDGFADLGVGAEGGATGKGAAYVFLGGSTGISSTRSQRLDGENLDDLLGESLATGDVNGDARADLIVGAYAYGATNVGRAYVFLGQADGVSVTPQRVLTGEQDHNWFGQKIVCRDVNADGRVDLLLGVPQFATDHDGKVYVYNGSADGIELAPTITFSGVATSGEGLGAIVE